VCYNKEGGTCTTYYRFDMVIIVLEDRIPHTVAKCSINTEGQCVLWI